MEKHLKTQHNFNKKLKKIVYQSKERDEVDDDGCDEVERWSFYGIKKNGIGSFCDWPDYILTEPAVWESNFTTGDEGSD